MVEVLITAAIMTGSILAVTAVAQKSIYVAREAFHVNQATFLLEEGAEAVRIARDSGWNNISTLTIGTTYYPSFSGGTWILSTTSNVVGIFTRTVVLANVNRDTSTQDIVSSGGTLDPNTKLVTVTVTWIEGGSTITKTLQFYIMDVFS